jgi:hypothetical protein
VIGTVSQSEKQERAPECSIRAALVLALCLLDRAGYTIAPKEPTDSMCDAATRSTSAWIGDKHGVDLRRLKHRIRYRAMLAHAPSPLDYAVMARPVNEA